MLKQVIITCFVALVTARFVPYENQCVDVKAKICQQLDPENYLYTSFPNFMNHTSQFTATKELENYLPVIVSGCSNALQMFLCSLYIPICNPNVGKRIPPCKSLCQAARQGCEPLLNSAHIRWPSSMECHHFPDENSGELCVSLPNPQPSVQSVEPKDALVKNKIQSQKRTRKVSATVHLKKELKPMQEVVMSCPSNRQISVRKVWHWPEFNADCCPIDTLERISKRCNGKQNCAIIFDKHTITAGCVATMKKTAVKYKCVSKSRDVIFRKSLGCNPKHKNKTQ